jgi:shikimate kinase
MAAVVLVGMMGCGKTTIGRMLAEEMGVPFCDTDHLLQYRLGRPVHQLFELYGEETFRQHESRILKDLEKEDRVLATGGGIVVRPENWVELERLGVTVFLDVAEATLIERLRTAKKRRPLLETENWEERVHLLRASRLPLYSKAQVRVVLENDDFKSVVTQIRERLP